MKWKRKTKISKFRVGENSIIITVHPDENWPTFYVHLHMSDLTSQLTWKLHSLSDLLHGYLVTLFDLLHRWTSDYIAQLSMIYELNQTTEAVLSPIMSQVVYCFYHRFIIRMTRKYGQFLSIVGACHWFVAAVRCRLFIVQNNLVCHMLKDERHLDEDV